MIVFDLGCAEGHRFEGWFGSSDDFARQTQAGLLTCPKCGSSEVAKAPMAPAVPSKGNASKATAGPSSGANKHPVASGPLPPKVAKAIEALAKAQADALQNSTWVGDKFADQSRAMHYGDRDPAPIHGRASKDEARSLADEGIPVLPLPFPVAPPDELN